MFIDCASAGQTLDAHGIRDLCHKLHLAEHYEYVVARLLPHGAKSLLFPQFKRRFVRLLPAIVHVDEDGNKEGSKSPSSSDRHEDLSDEAPSSTANHMLPQGDDPTVAIPFNTRHRITADELNRIVRRLGLASNGKLGEL